MGLKESLPSIRARIKAEAERRNAFGSMAEMADDANYGLSESPEAGSPILAEQGRAVIDPLIFVKDFGKLRNVTQGDRIPPDFTEAALLTYVNTLESETKDGNATSCRSACTGLCIAFCTSGCRGECTSSCGGACASNCSASCGSGCAGTCANSCTGNCANSCRGNCANSTSK